MSDEELDSTEPLSFDVLQSDDKANSLQDVRSRLQVLEEDNLALRQELNRAKRPPSRADDQTTKETDKDQTVPKRSYEKPLEATRPASWITQSQNMAFQKMIRRQDTPGAEYMPSMGPSRLNPHQSQEASILPPFNTMHELYPPRETTPDVTLIAIVQKLLASNREMEDRLSKLECFYQKNEQYGGLPNRIAVCERKMESMISRRDTFETKIREAVSVVSAQSQSKERTFQAYVMSKDTFPQKAVDFRLDRFEKIFFPSAHFSQETCEYTVPESGLYEFRVRWRQSGVGQIRVTIHWGEESVSRLGQTSPENDVLCPVIRRFLEEKVKVRLSAMIISGAPKLETCDFGGSFITSKNVVEVPRRGK